MASFRKANWMCLLCAGFGVVLSSAADAFAAQGPGASQGTADHLTQLAMAVLVYGAAALVVGAGLVGAVMRR
jgi:uncharacterized membrane protein YbhN (UPF0104 family)